MPDDMRWALPYLEALDAADDNGLFLAIYLALWSLTAAGLWATFVKAGRRGWTSIIPLVNVVVFARVAGKSAWWTLLLLVPGINLFFAWWMTNRLAKSFGKGMGFGLGLVFLPFIFFPRLGFGAAKYQMHAALTICTLRVPEDAAGYRRAS